MSAQGRDVVRYIKSVERGPEQRIIRPEEPPFFEFLGWPTNPDWIRARDRDLFDPFAKTAIRAYTDPTWSTFRAEFARYLRRD